MAKSPRDRKKPEGSKRTPSKPAKPVKPTKPTKQTRPTSATTRTSTASPTGDGGQANRDALAHDADTADVARHHISANRRSYFANFPDREPDQRRRFGSLDRSDRHGTKHPAAARSDRQLLRHDACGQGGGASWRSAGAAHRAAQPRGRGRHAAQGSQDRHRCGAHHRSLSAADDHGENVLRGKAGWHDGSAAPGWQTRQAGPWRLGKPRASADQRTHLGRIAHCIQGPGRLRRRLHTARHPRRD